MARSAKPATEASKAPAAPTPSILPIQMTLQASESTAFSYVNFAEVNFTQHDFTISWARVPAKLNVDQIEIGQKTGILSIPAELQLSIPPTLLPGLIRALTTAKEAYERLIGVAIADTSKTDAQ